MSKSLQSCVGNTELLQTYGSEPYDIGLTVADRWYELTHPWSVTSSYELGEIRQIMLKIDKEVSDGKLD